MMGLLVAITIPLIISGIELIRVYSDVRGLVMLLDLYRLKPGGMFPSSNLLGNVVMVALPPWAALALWHHRKSLRVASLFITIFLTIILILTNSRAAMFGLALCAVLFAILANKLKHLLIVTSLSILLLLSMPVVSGLISFGLRMERGTTTRDQIWKNTYDIIRENPLLGIGLGNYSAVYNEYYKTGWERGFFGNMANAHNIFLDFTVRLGISGFLLIICLFYLAFKEGVAAAKKAVSREDRAMIFGAIGVIVALLGWSLFEAGGVLGDGRPYPDIFFWIYFCLLIKINKLYSSPAEHIFFSDTKH